MTNRRAPASELPATPVGIESYASSRVFDGVRPIERSVAARIVADLDAQIAALPAIPDLEAVAATPSRKPNRRR